MSEFHQIEFFILIFSVMLARLQSMETDRIHEFVGDYEEYITGWDNRKTLTETPKNFIKINLIVALIYYSILLFIFILDYLGGL